MEEGGVPYIGITVNFKETVTKEQMIQADKYIIEELKKLFPPEKKTIVGGEIFIAYTSDGIANRDLISESLSIKAYLPLNSEEIQWEKLYPPINKDWVAFDPYADPVPAEQPSAEQPPTEVAANEIPLSKVTGVLSEIGFEVTDSMEASDGSVLWGEDSQAFSSYMIALDEDKNVQSMSCLIKVPDNNADIRFKAMTYMAVCAKMPYEDKEVAEKAVRFVADNMDMGMLTLTKEVQTTTIEGWNISLSYIEKSETYMLELKR